MGLGVYLMVVVAAEDGLETKKHSTTKGPYPTPNEKAIGTFDLPEFV